MNKQKKINNNNKVVCYSLLIMEIIISSKNNRMECCFLLTKINSNSSRNKTIEIITYFRILMDKIRAKEFLLT